MVACERASSRHGIQIKVSPAIFLYATVSKGINSKPRILKKHFDYATVI